jgi:hypothetical protein
MATADKYVVVITQFEPQLTLETALSRARNLRERGFGSEIITAEEAAKRVCAPQQDLTTIEAAK